MQCNLVRFLLSVETSERVSSKLFLIFKKREEIMESILCEQIEFVEQCEFFCCGEINERMNRLNTGYLLHTETQVF